MQKLYFASHILVLGPPNGEKRPKGVKDTKSTILRPMMRMGKLHKLIAFDGE